MRTLDERGWGVQAEALLAASRAFGSALEAYLRDPTLGLERDLGEVAEELGELLGSVRIGADLLAPGSPPTPSLKERLRSLERSHQDLETRYGRMSEAFQALMAARDETLEQERASREGAEAARQRLAFLEQASMLLSESLELETTLERVAELCVPFLADWCVIDFLDEDGDMGVAVAHRDPEREEALVDLRRRFPVHDFSPGGSGQVLTTSTPLLVPECSESWLEGLSGDPRLKEAVRSVLMEEMGLRSLLSVPLNATGRCLGVLTLASASKTRAYREEDLALAGDLARRAAQAIDNARLYASVSQAYRQQQTIAETLQWSFLPKLPERIGQLSIGYLYEAASAEELVGGDFYDLFPLDGGRMGVVLGDVSGKGVGATVVTAMARYALRGLAREYSSPATVLSKLDGLLNAELGDEKFVTLFYGVLDLATMKLVYASAGHEPALVELAEGGPLWLEATGPVLGPMLSESLGERLVTLEAGRSLLLFTDGLSEARRGGEFLGVEGVAELLNASRGLEPSARVAGILDGAREFAGASLYDDVAVLLLQVDGGVRPGAPD
ncbi:MAG TPA: SpoIIE family protein phosphatase [Armatimonadota bacterium]